jgi:hypothetical protein
MSMVILSSILLPIHLSQLLWRTSMSLRYCTFTQKHFYKKIFTPLQNSLQVKSCGTDTSDKVRTIQFTRAVRMLTSCILSSCQGGYVTISKLQTIILQKNCHHIFSMTSRQEREVGGGKEVEGGRVFNIPHVFSPRKSSSRPIEAPLHQGVEKWCSSKGRDLRSKTCGKLEATGIISMFVSAHVSTISVHYVM